MSKNILDFLGYESLEEFTTFANDVADLFEQRSGYVYRFKNFSWISYILHSGAPNKNAILRLKNNKELEVRILIEEILPIGSSDGYYKVDLQPASNNIDFSNNYTISSSQFKPKGIEAEAPKKIEDSLPNPQNSSFSTSQNNLNDHEPHPSTAINTHKEDATFSSGFDISFMDPSEFTIPQDEKPKIDDKPLPVSFDEPFTEEITIHPKIDTNESSLDIHTNAPIEKTTNEPNYDPLHVMKILGLEPRELKLFLHEYCDHIEMVSIALEDAMNEGDNQGKQALLEQLKGTAKHLRIEHISSLLEHLSQSDELEILHDLQAYAHKLKTLSIDN